MVETAPTMLSLLQEALYDNSPLLGSWKVFGYLVIHGGWVIFVVFLVLLLWHYWDLYIKEDYAQKNRRWVLLAIDVPRDNEQTPKAVENIFAHLAGAHGTRTLLERYWSGNTQDWFSLELVSIEGYVQFIIRTVDRFRDLVEAAVYGQYPDAEITEIEDYTDGYPTVFPNERYDMYGTEFVLVEDQALPLRTYPEFEHQMSQEFKDPLMAFLETMNKLGVGEQIWFQILIEPTNSAWKKQAVLLIDKLMGRKSGNRGLLGNIAGEIGKFGQSASDQFSGGSGIIAEAEAQASGSRVAGGLYLLAPHERAQVEGVANKIKKIGFITKIRLVYIATKEHFNAQHGREAMIGAMKQFNAEDMNSIKPDTKHVGVHAHYMLQDWRKNMKRTKIMDRYKERSVGYGRRPFVLNIEELATIWHFPSKTMITPLRHMVERTEFKHTPPPAKLPYASDLPAPETGQDLSEQKPPKDLPV